MAGFPNKITRNDIGPTFENEVKVANPKREFDANTLNLMAWQLAGMNGTALRGLVVATLNVVSLLVTVNAQWFAWDPNQALPNMAFTRTSTGSFTWSLPDGGLGVGVYNDKDNNPVSVSLLAAMPTLQGSNPAMATGFVNLDGKTGGMFVFLLATAGLTDPATFVMSFI
jgi:hypothetical protein